MRKIFLTLATFALLAGSFAAPAFAGQNEFFGTGIGAAMGGLLGSQFGRGTGQLAATGTGIFLGGIMGNSIGSSMDRADRYAPSNYGYASPPPVYYGAAYAPNYVAPPAPPPMPTTYRDEDSGRYCREFTQEIRIEGRLQESYGTACLQPDGSWRVVE